MRVRLPVVTVAPASWILRWAAPVALLVVALLLVAPRADAATVTYSESEGGVTTYAANGGETLNVSVGYRAAACPVGAGLYACVTFSGDATVYLGDTVAQQACHTDAGMVLCALDDAHQGVRIVGGPGHDHVSVWDEDLSGFPANTAYPIEIFGGPGNDTLDGGSARETMHGGPGADLLTGRGGDDVLYGDDGNDTLRGDGSMNGNAGSAGGNDRLYGGAGDDTLTGDASGNTSQIGSDVLDGGPGVDTVYDDWYRYDGSGNAQDPPPTVTLDGAANDGRPGEGDNVVGVEKIDTGYLPNQAAPATFVGSDGPDTINLLFAHGTLNGRGGDDVLTGSDYADVIDGGPGNDQISGGFGDDVIAGGPGVDNIGGDRTAACFYGPIYGACTVGSGNDTIYAQDGEADTIDCGPGNDVAYVDAIDHVTNCETVYTAGGGIPPICTTNCGAPPKPKLPAAPTVKLSLAKKLRLRTIARTRKLPVVCRVKGAARCRVQVTITAKDAKKLKLKVKKRAKTFVLGTRAKTFKKRGKATLQVKLAKKTAKALRRARKLRITVKATSTAKNHSARTVTIRRTLKR